MEGERELKQSVLLAQFDDDDEAIVRLFSWDKWLLKKSRYGKESEACVPDQTKLSK